MYISLTGNKEIFLFTLYIHTYIQWNEQTAHTGMFTFCSFNPLRPTVLQEHNAQSQK